MAVSGFKEFVELMITLAVIEIASWISTQLLTCGRYDTKRPRQMKAPRKIFKAPSSWSTPHPSKNMVSKSKEIFANIFFIGVCQGLETVNSCTTPKQHHTLTQTDTYSSYLFEKMSMVTRGTAKIYCILYTKDDIKENKHTKAN
jgi:hypothetical protein